MNWTNFPGSNLFKDVSFEVDYEVKTHIFLGKYKDEKYHLISYNDKQASIYKIDINDDIVRLCDCKFNSAMTLEEALELVEEKKYYQML